MHVATEALVMVGVTQEVTGELEIRTKLVAREGEKKPECSRKVV